MEAQIRLENTALRRGLEGLDVSSASSDGTVLARGAEDVNSVNSFQIDELYQGNRGNSDMQFLPEQQRNNQLDVMSQGPRFSMHSSPIGNKGGKHIKKPTKQKEPSATGRMTTRKLSRNADLNQE